MKIFRLSKYVVFSAPILSNSHRKSRIVYSTISNCRMLISEHVYELLITNNITDLKRGTKKILASSKIIVSLAQNELKPLPISNKDTTESCLPVILNFSKRENASCSRCSQFREDNDECCYKSEVISYVEQKIKNGVYKILYVVWKGIDETQFPASIGEMTTSLRQLCEKYNLLYTSKIVINGFKLGKEVALTPVRQLKFSSYQIMLDLTRQFGSSINQEVVLNSTINTIRNLYPSNLFDQTETVLEIVFFIDELNYERAFTAINLLGSHDLQRKVILSFRPAIERNSQVQHDNSKSFANLEIEILMYAAKNGFEINGLIPDRQLQILPTTDVKFSQNHGRNYSCYGLSDRNLEFDSHFDKSTASITEVSKKSAGRRPKKNDQINVRFLGLPCQECSLLPICGGHCSVMWEEQKANCPSFKFNIQERLIVEYLQRNYVNDFCSDRFL